MRRDVKRSDRGRWPARVIRQAEFTSIWAELTADATNWIITGFAHRQIWHYFIVEAFLCDSTDGADVDLAAQLATLRSATAIVRFADGSALQIDLRRRDWYILAHDPDSLAHRRARSTGARLTRYDNWWRHQAVTTLAIFTTLAIAAGALLLAPPWRYVISLACILLAALITATRRGLCIRDRFLPDGFLIAHLVQLT